MTLKDKIANEYFDWMFHLACNKRYSNTISYRKLFTHLHNTEFIFTIQRDVNRALDGIDLRHRFATAQNCEDLIEYLDGPCSVLEMMIALSIRCEETIMDDPVIGDRTGQWFWNMITNLGLGAMIDSKYDKEEVDYILARFLNREYEPNGKGGLFTVRHCEDDLRTVEIWYQMCWYLNNIV